MNHVQKTVNWHEEIASLQTCVPLLPENEMWGCFCFVGEVKDLNFPCVKYWDSYPIKVYTGCNLNIPVL